MYLEKLGLWPTPTDVLDLIPWSWLVDWFIGLHDYVQLMSEINTDRFLINYGFLTYKSATRVTASRQLFANTSYLRELVPPESGKIPTLVPNFLQFNAELTMRYVLRRSLDNLPSVKTYSGKGLSANQSLILSALFHQFT